MFFRIGIVDPKTNVNHIRILIILTNDQSATLFTFFRFYLDNDNIISLLSLSLISNCLTEGQPISETLFCISELLHTSVTC